MVMLDGWMHDRDRSAGQDGIHDWGAAVLAEDK
jgi:hypothetical protein